MITFPRTTTSFCRSPWWQRLAGDTFSSPVSLSSTRGAVQFLHEGPDTLDELLDRHLVNKKSNEGDELDGEQLVRQRLTSTRREALNLYRDILRATRFFSWPDARGVSWRDVLRSNARREFEEARFERDPEIITRLLIGGRDAVQSALDKLADAHRKNIEEERIKGGN
ncbi:hypothetical protein HPP92_013000 [Vanilla planifolia]|uniref:Complex 1 LYR protein domain-containing protein n=1 Tax=Vanilla planifolia TaxID=51239 RepID=A0A835QRK0_VANPL|nr:hypothetical protein HPP92_013000 [Vanilla planifolia]